MSVATQEIKRKSELRDKLEENGWKNTYMSSGSEQVLLIYMRCPACSAVIEIDDADSHQAWHYGLQFSRIQPPRTPKTLNPDAGAVSRAPRRVIPKPRNSLKLKETE